MPRVRVALCQLNTVVGDLDGNAARVLDAYQRAEADGCDIAVFPELAITGYPPEDLLLKPGFVRANREALEKVAAATGRCAAVVGFVDADRDLFNAAAVCANGRVAGTYHKRNLPNYASSTSSATSHPARSPSCCSRSPASRSACPSARTHGVRSARSASRPQAAPS